MIEQLPSVTIFEQFLVRAHRFYAPPPIAVRAIEMAGSTPADLAAIAQCLEEDPELVAKTVRLANCSLFGLAPSADEVADLLHRIGPRTFQFLVFFSSVPTTAATTLTPEMRQVFWHYFLLSAAASGEIAASLFGLSPVESFAHGVTRSLGILALVHELGDSYGNFLLGVWESLEDLSTQESLVLGFDHQRLGFQLLERGSLPATFVQNLAVSSGWESREPHALPQEPLSRVLNLADLIARMFAAHRTELLGLVLKNAQDDCRVTDDQLVNIVVTLETRVVELAVALGIEPPSDICYTETLRKALREMRDQQHSALPDASGRTADVEAAAAIDSCSGESFLARISAAMSRCRLSRCPLSLVLTQLDPTEDSGRPEARLEVLQRLNSAIRQAAKDDGAPTLVGDNRFALILEKYDRRHAVELAWKIVDTVRTWGDNGHRELLSGLTVSVGLATLAMAPRNFPSDQIFTAAQRCLHGVQLSGGDGVKSIDIL